jgi:hypothetical protein
MCKSESSEADKLSGSHGDNTAVVQDSPTAGASRNLSGPTASHSTPYEQRRLHQCYYLSRTHLGAPASVLGGNDGLHNRRYHRRAHWRGLQGQPSATHWVMRTYKATVTAQITCAFCVGATASALFVVVAAVVGAWPLKAPRRMKA